MSQEVRVVDPPGTEEGEPGRAVRSVQRAIDIMSLFTDGSTQRTIAEIVAETGLAKTTAIRLLYTLEHNGLLASAAHGFVPGPGLWRWAFAIHQAWELPPDARRVMSDLVDAERETVNLYIRRGNVRICVAQEESPLPLRHVVRIGDHLPLWAGASSKVLLSSADRDAVAAIHAAAPSDVVGPAALDEFLTEIGAVDRTGYAQSHGERETGLSAVAVPVRSTRGEVVAALSFSGPTARFPADRVPRLAELLTEAASTFTDLGIDHPLRAT